MQAVKLSEWAAGGFTGVLTILLCGSGVLLIIAWVNIINILLVQTSERSQEMSLRLALGANRLIILKQYAIEALIKTIAGSIGSISFAYLILRIIIIYAPPYTFPEGTRLTFSTAAAIFCASFSFVVMLSSTILPVIISSRKNPHEVLKESARTSTDTHRKGIIQWALVCLQIAFASALITSGVLTFSYLQSLENTYLGFSTSNLLTARIILPETKYKTVNEQNIFFKDLIEKLNQSSLIESAAVISSLPVYGGMGSKIKFQDGSEEKAQIQFASEQYSKTINAQILQGRFLTRDDLYFQKYSAVVNESFVKAIAKNTNVMGKLIQVSALKNVEKNQPLSFEITGVIKDIRNDGLEKNIKPEIYIPYSVSNLWHRRIIIKTRITPEKVEPILRKTVTSIDPNLPLADVRTLRQTLENISLGKPRFQFIVTIVFVLCGIVLSAVGCYGIIAYVTSRRLHEIGIRIALGSPVHKIINLVVGKFAVVISIGSLLGIILSISLNRILQTQIPGMELSNWVVFSYSILILMLIGLIACAHPLIMAIRTNPVSTLRRI